MKSPTLWRSVSAPGIYHAYPLVPPAEQQCWTPCCLTEHEGRVVAGVCHAVLHVALHLHSPLHVCVHTLCVGMAGACVCAHAHDAPSSIQNGGVC